METETEPDGLSKVAFHNQRHSLNSRWSRRRTFATNLKKTKSHLENVFYGVVYPDITDISWPEKQTINVMDLFIIYLASSNYKLSCAVCKNTVNSIQIQKHPIGSNSVTSHSVGCTREAHKTFWPGGFASKEKVGGSHKFFWGGQGRVLVAKGRKWLSWGEDDVLMSKSKPSLILSKCMLCLFYPAFKQGFSVAALPPFH